MDFAGVIAEFRSGFPEYTSNDFYIAGEDYAGIFGPRLAHALNRQGVELNLKGILIGGGVTYWPVINRLQACPDFLAWHAIIDNQLLNAFHQNCDYTPSSQKCQDTVQQINTLMNNISPLQLNESCPTGDDSIVNWPRWTYSQVSFLQPPEK
jgi:cathepsin A (carboxypeptidase C)